MVSPCTKDSSSSLLEYVNVQWDGENPSFKKSVASIEQGLEKLDQEMTGLRGATERLVDRNQAAIKAMPYRVVATIASIDSSKAMIKSLSDQIAAVVAHLSDGELCALRFPGSEGVAPPLATRLFQDRLVEAWRRRIEDSESGLDFLGVLSRNQTWAPESLAALIMAADEAGLLPRLGLAATGKCLETRLAETLSVALSQGVHGKVLYLSHLPEVLADGVAWAKAVRQVEQVVVRETFLRPTHYQWLENFVHRTPPIKKLFFEGCQWDEGFIPWLERLLATCPRSFQISVPGLDDEAVEGLAKALAVTEASYVGFAKGEITDRGAAVLADVAASRASLLNLDLNQNLIGYEGYILLFEAAQKNPLMTIQAYCQAP